MTGTLDTPMLPAVIEVFMVSAGLTGGSYGQGEVYLGSGTMAVGPVWTVALTGLGLPGQFLTATATDSAGNTSEFALNVPVWDQDQEKFDYGDAPDPPYFTYRTCRAARPTRSCPGCISEGRSMASPTANPMQRRPATTTTATIDEDGVTFPLPLVPGQAAQIDVIASWVGWIDAWIDFNGDGQWHSTEQIVTNGVHTGSGLTISYPFTVPATAATGVTFARIRYSSSGNLLPYGPGAGGVPPDGEVEDHRVTIEQGQGEDLDWGDAPDGPAVPLYPTLAANNGARHFASPNFCIGTQIDTESDGQPSANADGDDLEQLGRRGWGDLVSDELRADEPGRCVCHRHNGVIDAWVDFNGNGKLA